MMQTYLSKGALCVCEQVVADAPGIYLTPLITCKRPIWLLQLGHVCIECRQ